MEPKQVEHSAATHCYACDGCSHQKVPAAGWCYMYRDRPEKLPCGQHDKFEEDRKAMGSLVRKHPQILAMMIMGMSR